MDEPRTWRQVAIAAMTVVAPVLAWLVYGAACWWLQEGRYP